VGAFAGKPTPEGMVFMGDRAGVPGKKKRPKGALKIHLFPKEHQKKRFKR
jgi:hypothetical protein